jgi:septal ring-binding cell division protein DamX
MSKAQKQAQNKFKEAVKIAKQLRAKDPKLTHPEAVKKAFAQLSGPAKKTAKPAAKKTAKPATKKTAKPAAKKTAKPAAKKTAKKSCVTDHRDSKSHNVNIRVVSGVDKLSAGAKKLWIEINKKGLFKFNTEENILKALYDEAIRKGQYKKAEYLQELIKDVEYY